jgi:trigger factor
VKVTAERIPESKVLLRIEIPPEEVAQSIEKTYRDLSRKIKVPGFRPGKAPRVMIERLLGGPESVQREGIDRLIDDSFRKALKDTDTHPIGEPDVNEVPEFHPGEPIVYQATVPVAPRVELGDYKSIFMQPIHVEATPDQVSRFMDNLRESNAEWVLVDRGARDHDQVVIDIQGVAGTVPTLYGPSGDPLLLTAGGREVHDVKAHEHYLDVQGPTEFAPGFDEEIIGMMAGSEKRFGLTLPPDYADSTLVNQSIVFTVKVHAVKEKKLPEVDDEFARKVAAVDTLERLREVAREQIQEQLQRDARTAYENVLVNTVIERSTIELPEVMVQRQIDAQLEDMKAELSRDKVTWPEFLQRTHATEEKVREDLREPARKSLTSYLILRQLAAAEGITVMPAEVNVEIEATASQFGRMRNAIRERLSTREQKEKIEFRLFYRRALNRLIEIAQQPRERPAQSVAASSTELAERSSAESSAVEAEAPAPPAADSTDTSEPTTPRDGSAEAVAEVRTSEETTTHG